MNKDDNGKLRWDLLPYESVEEVVRVLTYGCTKYGNSEEFAVSNWQTVSNPQSRYFAAAMRHLVEWKTRSSIDRESGYSHLAHACANLLFLIHFDKEYAVLHFTEPCGENDQNA